MEGNPAAKQSNNTPKNTLEERFNFYRRCQQAQETLTHFIADVRRLAKTCEFHPQEEEFLIRDRVLFGLKNKSVQSQIIKIGGNPSLEIAMAFCSEFHRDAAGARSRRKDEKPSLESSERPDVLSTSEVGDEGESPRAAKTIQTNIRIKPNLNDRNSRSTANKYSPTTCSSCRKTFKNLRQLTLHKNHFHQPSTPNRFRKQHSIISNQSNTFKPMKPEKFECYICKKQLESRVKLRFHIYHHSRIKKWLCTKCGMQFVAESQLKIHLMRDDHNISTIENTKPFVCNICAKRFTQKNSLDTHERVHSGAKPFSCKSCDKRFASVSNLNQHKRTHSDIKAYHCNVCDYQCRYPGNLRNHMRVHVGKC